MSFTYSSWLEEQLGHLKEAEDRIAQITDMIELVTDNEVKRLQERIEADLASIWENGIDPTYVFVTADEAKLLPRITLEKVKTEREDIDLYETDFGHVSIIVREIV